MFNCSFHNLLTLRETLPNAIVVPSDFTSDSLKNWLRQFNGFFTSQR